MACIFADVAAKRKSSAGGPTDGVEDAGNGGGGSGDAATLLPATSSTDMEAVMAAATDRVQTAARQRNFQSRLEVMRAGECLSLRQAGAGPKANAVATLTCLAGGSFLLVHTADPAKGHEQLSANDAHEQLSHRFALPAVSKEELTAQEAAAVRKREARQVALDREMAKRAAIEAATHAWWRQQAELAAELGITFNDWQRIATLLSKPPPMRVGGNIVLNSVAIGRAIVIDAALEHAVAAPLHESVRAAAERSSQQPADGKRARGPALTQTQYGKDVTELADDLADDLQQKDKDASQKRQKQEQDGCNKKAKQAEKVDVACRKLCSARAGGDALKLAIPDLIALITWKGGTVPASTTKDDKPDLVKAWLDLKVSEAEVRARAGESAVPAKLTKKAAPKPRHREIDSSDEDADDEDEAEADAMDCDSSDEQSEDESEEDEGDAVDSSDEEPMWEVKAIHAQKGKGKGLRYDVEWETGERTWEPPTCFPPGNVVLKAWKEKTANS